MKLTEIIQGWTLYWESSSRTRELIKSRLEICDRCPEKQVLSPLGQVLLANEHQAAYKCRKCSCFLDAKAANPKSKCPLGKWPDPATGGYYG